MLDGTGTGGRRRPAGIANDSRGGETGGVGGVAKLTWRAFLVIHSTFSGTGLEATGPEICVSMGATGGTGVGASTLGGWLAGEVGADGTLFSALSEISVGAVMTA